MDRFGFHILQRILSTQRLLYLRTSQTVPSLFYQKQLGDLNRLRPTSLNGIHCPHCLVRRQPLHCSAAVHSTKAKNAKKKLIHKVKRSPKKLFELDQGVAPVKYNMTVQELATALGKDVDHVFECMVLMKKYNTSRYDEEDSVIDNFDVIKETCKMSAKKFVFEKKKKDEKENKDLEKQLPPDPAVLVKRCPVVTIMGHVDHGKTTLLDALRHSNIVDREFGGITQHIGAFSVNLESGENITFLDTPGHAAFSAMRARGAYVTDIVVLVVAGDDGVMKQTVQSVQFAQEAGVPIIVAINKCDKHEADIEFTKRGLMAVGLVPEDVGGDVQCVPISALKKTNLGVLQEAILAQSELMEIMADPVGQVEAVVIESLVHPGRGKLATALVQRGTLKKGKLIIAGTAWAKVRGMFNEHGEPVREAGPGVPVQVIGWKELPHAGEEISEVETEHRAREVVKYREDKKMEEKMSNDELVIKQKIEQHYQDYSQKRQANLDLGRRRSSIYRREKTKEEIITHVGPQLAVVIKGDVDGSVEAIMDSLDTYESDQCYLHILSYGTGIVTEQDVEMAASFNGVVYAFNTDVGSKVAQLAKTKKVALKQHNVIYKMIDDVKEELTNQLEPLDTEVTVGEANVQQFFTITDGKKKVPVAGCRCVKGALHRKKHFKLIRDDEVLIDGKLSSLRHFKNEVDSVKLEVECGIMFEDKSVQPEVGDTIVCYEIERVKQDLDWEFDF